jgi:hypothetical protein
MTSSTTDFLSTLNSFLKSLTVGGIILSVDFHSCNPNATGFNGIRPRGVIALE